jgi:tetratricopeptide (TPR) repeat protein
MTDIVADFQKLIDGLASSTSQESDLLLLQLDPIAAARIRLCAVPHTFDAPVLRVLDPSLDESGAVDVMHEFQSLGAVMQLPNALALHDVIRQQLFRQWLAPEKKEGFSSVSRRLAQYYQPEGSATAVEREVKENSFVFHMVGAEINEGFKHFQLLYKERREHLNTSGCAILVRLMREYDTVLPSARRAWLTFYEAEIAGDTRDWPRARKLLDDLLAQDITPNLRSMALLRFASVSRQSGVLKNAQAACVEALQLLKEHRSGVDTGDYAALHLVRYEQGLIARDQGDVEHAQDHLNDAIRLARAAGAQTDVVAASNSLGTLLLRISPHEAVRIFTDCMKLLTPTQDGLRIAQILNNLAIAHANAAEWEQSESYYQKSLDIKRIAGDSFGQASTLFNMARVYKSLNKPAQAREAMSEAATLFENVNALRSTARAYRELARMGRLSEPSEAAANARKALTLYERADEGDEFKATNREFKDLLGDGVKATKPEFKNLLDKRPSWPLWTTVAVLVVVVIFAMLMARFD